MWGGWVWSGPAGRGVWDSADEEPGAQLGCLMAKSKRDSGPARPHTGNGGTLPAGEPFDSPGLLSRRAQLATFSSPRCTSIGVRPRPFACRPATPPTFAPPLGTVRGVPQRRNRRCLGIALASTAACWARSGAAGRASINLGRDLPAATDAFDQPLWPDLEIRDPCREPPGPVRPIASAGRQNGHVALEVLHHGEAMG